MLTIAGARVVVPTVVVVTMVVIVVVVVVGSHISNHVILRADAG